MPTFCLALSCTVQEIAETDRLIIVYVSAGQCFDLIVQPIFNNEIVLGFLLGMYLPTRLPICISDKPMQ